jgi:hypothetical protein
VKVYTVTESRVEPKIELIEGQHPFLYFDRGAGGGTHFFAHHKVVCECKDALSLTARVSVAEESFGRFWFMPEVEGDTDRAIALIRVGRGCRIRPYQKNPSVRALATDKLGTKAAVLVLSRGAELTIERPEDAEYNNLLLFRINWDGENLNWYETEDPERPLNLKNLTYI